MRSRSPRASAPRSVAAAAVALGLLSLPFAGCPAFQPEDWLTELPSFEISAEEGGTISVLGLELVIPPGALPSDELITVEVRDLADLPELTGGLGPVFEFKPDGLTFNSPVTLSVPVPEDAELLDLVFLSQIEGDADDWRTLYGTTFADGVATAEIRHFSGLVVTTVASTAGGAGPNPNLATCLPETCGGTIDDLIGTWNFVKGCEAPRQESWEGCAEARFSNQTLGTGTVEFTASTIDLRLDADTVYSYVVPIECAAPGDCSTFATGTCVDASNSMCECEVFRNDWGTLPPLDLVINGNDLVIGDASLGWTAPFCVTTVGSEQRLTMGDASQVNFFTRPAPSVTVPVKVFLQGPLDSATRVMNDGLRTTGVLPKTEPYTGLGYTHVGGGGETVTDDVLAVNDANDSLVDWVVVELRDATTPTTLVASRSGLLQRDGDVVDVDGTSALRFDGVDEDDYYVAVRHVNHLGVMTAAAVAVGGATTLVDFTTVATYGTNALNSSTYSGFVACMWAGDSNRDGELALSGQANDAFPVFSKVLTDPGNTTFANTYVVNGYHAEDLNRDGRVVLTGATNDSFLLNVNVITHPANASFSQTFVVPQQLP